MFEIDTNIFLRIHSISEHYPDLWLFLGGWFGFVVVITALLFVSFHKHGLKNPLREFKKHVREWFTVLVVTGGTWAVTGLLKILFERPRPFESLPIDSLSMPGSLDSFPSGHATFYMALALVVYRYHKKAGVFFIGCAVIVSVSRIITGVHYPVDILGGWLVAYIFYRIIKHK
jgi:membrane-associated phospholipid phosphatase